MTGVIQFETAELSVLEPGQTVLVPIVRTGDLSGRVEVQYATNNQTAIAGQDYVATSGVIVFEPGVSRVQVPVTITNDSQSEASELFGMSIINVSSGSLAAPRTTQVTILDDENRVQPPAEPPLTSNFDVTLRDTITGLDQPIAMEFSPTDSNTMYVAEKSGLVKVVNTTTGTSTTILDIRSQVNNTQDRGLLDIAVHPDLENNPYLYAFYVVDPPGTSGTGNAGVDGGGNRYSHVVRYTLDESTGFKTVVPNSGTVIVGKGGSSSADISGGGALDSTSDLTVPDSEKNTNGSFKQDYLKVDSRSHAGGSLEFGPDGKLYISVGDGTSFNATDERTISVQDVNSLSGKILRVDPITGQGLSDNPFYSNGQSLDSNASKVYQMGLRNPFSMSFDEQGQLFVTDTGWNNYEEINSGGPGANFGWPYYEGGDGGVISKTPGYQSLPSATAFYEKVASGEISITAAYRAFSHNSADPGYQVQAIVGSDDVIRSPLYPDALQGDYIFTDYSQGEIFAVDVNDRTKVDFIAKVNGAPVHYKLADDGYLYYVDIARGTIGRLEINEKNAQAPVLSGSLEADYYQLTSQPSALSNINFNQTPTFEQNVTRVAQANTNGALWAGGPADNFAARYRGDMDIKKAGSYTFYLNSDDGSRLFIDGKMVIENDGLHAPVDKSVTLDLTAGPHKIELIYFEASGGSVIDLDWSGPGFARQDMVYDGQSKVTVTMDTPNEVQYVYGTAAPNEIFSINGKSTDYGFRALDDVDGYVVWGPTGYDLLLDGIDAIRFTDTTIDLAKPSANGEVKDIPNLTQYVTGVGNTDTFVINGKQSDYGFARTEDGKGHVVWGATGYDLLYGFETIKFNDGSVSLGGSPPSNANTVNDIVRTVQFAQGTTGRDVFVINGNAANYGWGPTEDGQDHVVWANNGSGYDILLDWEAIQFNDRTVELV
jgi:glucose/arabinose dehydrogenase